MSWRGWDLTAKEGKDEDFDVADTIGKALALVTQV
jgi:phage terminase large subunit-like protein